MISPHRSRVRLKRFVIRSRLVSFTPKFYGDIGIGCREIIDNLSNFYYCWVSNGEGELMESKSMRLISSMVLTAFLLIVSELPARATYYSGGMPSATFSIKPWNYNSTWQTPLNAALASWNATATPANITKSTGATATLTVSSTSDTWYGLYTPTGIWPFRSFTIRLNSRTISADASNVSNFIRSSFAHELGHGLSLGDNPTTSAPSIMKHSRDRNTLYVPQSYDITEVNGYS
jgi:hypothetical protein